MSDDQVVRRSNVNFGGAAAPASVAVPSSAPTGELPASPGLYLKRSPIKEAVAGEVVASGRPRGTLSEALQRIVILAPHSSGLTSLACRENSQ